jgi:hypothetical protein
MLIGEIFGYGVQNSSLEAQAGRGKRHCPFAENVCTKTNKTDPLGICSLTDGESAASLCPKRFLQHGYALKAAAALAFGETAAFEIFPEVRVLEITDSESGKNKKIGKIDFVLGALVEGRITDFCAVEFQAVYFSGDSLREPFRKFVADGVVPLQERRADFRSSAQKRLMPQLDLKIPIFRRWGKKFFVVVDSLFFSSLPVFKRTQPENSEITWLVTELRRHGNDYDLQPPIPVFSDWDEVKTSLREGTAPTPSQVLAELQTKYDRKHRS